MKITCPRCGANTSYVPNNQKCYCEYCGSLVETKEFVKNEKANVQEFLNYDKPKENSKNEYDEYKCATCGAKLLITDGSILTDCVYCGSRQLTKTKSTFYHNPVEIIPFRVDRKHFMNSCLTYIRNSNEIPNQYKNIQKLIVTKGIYIPCKIEQYFVESSLTATIKSEDAIGRAEVGFYECMSSEMMLAIQDASTKISDKILEKIENYDFNQLKKFNPAYLTGFIVENANEHEKLVERKSEQKCIDKIKQEIEREFEKRRKKLGFVKKCTGTVDFKCLKNENTLLPLWYAKLPGSQIEFIMNGQSGKLHCISPFVETKYKTKSTYAYRGKKLMIIPALTVFGIFGISIFFTLMLEGWSLGWEAWIFVLGFMGVMLLICLISVIVSLSGTSSRTPVALKPNIDCISVWNRKVKQFEKIKGTKYNSKKSMDVYRNGKLILRDYDI